MELAAAKMIGAGLACIALVGAGIGIGNVFGSYLSGALRNPGAAATQTTNLLLGFALCEATGLFGLVIALIILFTLRCMDAPATTATTEAPAAKARAFRRSRPRRSPARFSGWWSRSPSCSWCCGAWRVRASMA